MKAAVRNPFPVSTGNKTWDPSMFKSGPRGRQSESLFRSYSRKTRVSPFSHIAMKKMVLLARPEQILASNRLRTTKMRCFDLWSKSMQKEAVNVLWAKNDPRVQRFNWRTRQLKENQILSTGDLSMRLDKYLARVQSRGRPKTVYKPKNQSWDALCDSQLTSCNLLQSELKSLKADFSQQRIAPQVENAFDIGTEGMKEYVHDEITDFRSKGMFRNAEILRASSKSLAKRNQKLGLSFYAHLRRKRPV